MNMHKTFFFGLSVTLASSCFAATDNSLKTIKAHMSTVPDIQVMNGQVEAVNKSTLSAQTSGTIESLPFDVGDFVKKGQIIAHIKSRTQKAGLRQAQASVGEAKAAVASARATYKSAMAKAEEAESDFNRMKSIFERKLIARAEFDRSKASAKTARAQVSAAKAALEAAKAGVSAAAARKTQAGEQLGYTTAIAPFSGIVVERHVELGEVVSAGKPLLTGISMKELRVTTDVPQSYIQGVRKYKKATVYIEEGTPAITAKSLTFFPYADPLTNAFKVRAQLDEGLDNIFPGTLVKIAFEVGVTNQLVIPAKAVAYRGEVTGVYVINEQGVPELRQVRLGRKIANGGILILAGLNDGETVAEDPVHATLYMKNLLAKSQGEATHE